MTFTNSSNFFVSSQIFDGIDADGLFKGIIRPILTEKYNEIPELSRKRKKRESTLLDPGCHWGKYFFLNEIF